MAHAWQVDYGGTAQELEAYFNHCGEIHRVTILCDKFSGHPKGYAYIEFATESSAQAAVELDKSIFRGRVIKVCVTARRGGGGRASGKDTQLPQPGPLPVSGVWAHQLDCWGRLPS